jgi:cyclin E
VTLISNPQQSGYLIDKVNDATYLNKQQTQQQQLYQQSNAYYLNNLNPNVCKKTNTDTENNYIICSKSSLYSNTEQTYIKSNTTPKLSNDEVATQDLTPTTPMLNLNWANGADLWKVMRSKELKYTHDHLYLKRHLGIEPQMRAILLDWLVEISYAYRLHRETWHLAVEYMDRFMTCCKSQMRVDRLQLIGMSSLFLAAKVEEIYPPKLKEFASHMENYTQNNEDAIQQFELFILKTLNWEISPVTANTWLMTYMQIASINYYTNLKNYYNRDEEDESRSNSKVHNSHMVMPLHIYKNSNSNLKDFKSTTNLTNQTSSNNKTTYIQQQFYLNNYMKSVTLLDLCMFDMESLKHSYSELAAAAMYHMLSFDTTSTSVATTSSSQNDAHLNAYLVQKCTGYKLYELDSCIKWMYPYADVCKDILTDEKMTCIKTFSNVDPEDAHNIQLYYQNLDLLVN